MDDRYFRLWILFREKVARKAAKSEPYASEKEVLRELLESMAILEAQTILED